MSLRSHMDRIEERRSISPHAAVPIAIWLCLAGMSPESGAHHGTFTFDGDTIVTLEGTVVQRRWTNPHSFFVLETRGSDTTPRQVVVEADGPSLLQPLGVGGESIVVGDRIVVYASPSRLEDSDEYLGREALREDGEVVALSVRYARDRDAASRPSAPGIVGVWVPDRAALFSFVPWRATWALTSKGREALENYDTTDDFAHARCVPATAPTVMVYPTAKVIEDRGDHLWLDADWMGATRTIFMDGRPHPDTDQQFDQGHSVGRWDGDVLVIDTTNFTSNAIGNAFGVPSGSAKHLVERLSLDEARTSLTYSFELEDPEFLAEPVANSFTWHYRPDVRASTLECDMESARRYLSD